MNVVLSSVELRKIRIKKIKHLGSAGKRTPAALAEFTSYNHYATRTQANLKIITTRIENPGEYAQNLISQLTWCLDIVIEGTSQRFMSPRVPVCAGNVWTDTGWNLLYDDGGETDEES